MAANSDPGSLSETSSMSDSSGLIQSSTEVNSKEENSSHYGATTKKTRLQRLKRRVNDPFNKKKLKKLESRYCAIEKVLKEQSIRLLDMINIHPRGETILRSVENLQIGCTNNINHESEDDFDKVQKAINELTNAANKLLKEITEENETRKKENDELKVCCQRSEIKIDEIKDLVTQINRHDMNHVQALKDLKDLQEALIADTPDDKIASDGVSAIRLNYIFDEEYNFLPFKTKLLVNKLLYLFGFDGLSAYCKALSTEISDDIIEACRSKDSSSLLLNHDICAKILIDWVKRSNDNDGPALFEVIQTHEKRGYQSIHCSYEDLCVGVRGHCEDLVQHRLDINFQDNQNNSSSSEKSLSFDENFFYYDSLERKCKQFMKVLSVEGPPECWNVNALE